jgi:hypothetical protein
MLVVMVLIADAWAVVTVAHSACDRRARVAWTLTILALPMLGLLLWLVAGPRAAEAPV